MHSLHGIGPFSNPTLMGCIHTSDKSRLTIRVMELKYYIDIFKQSVICRF